MATTHDKRPFDRVAVPTYRRRGLFEEKTLAFLERMDVYPGIIDAFVADQEEYDKYQDLAAAGRCNIHIGVPTLRGQRKHINRHYDEGTRVLMMDDDINDIRMKTGTNTSQPVTPDKFRQLCQRGFGLADRARAIMWGIGAVNNPFFMQHTGTVTLKHIVGCFWGTIITHDPNQDVSMDHKEDYERTIKHYLKYGTTPRLNGYAPDTKFYGTGGLESPDRVEASNKEARELMERYPYLIRENSKRTGPYIQVLLKDTRAIHKAR